MVPDVNLQKKPSFVHRLTLIFVFKLCPKIILKLELRYLVILIVNYLGDVIWTRYLTFQIKQVVVKEKVAYLPHLGNVTTQTSSLLGWKR